MNILAHMFLSGESDEIKLGNFMGDYVKGKDYQQYANQVQKGILLHRHIDYFTDNHPIVRRDKVFFLGRYRKYAGVVTDILYDHFLTLEWQWYTEVDFNEFIENIHQLLTYNLDLFPEGLKRIVPYLIKNQWFNSYKTLEGVRGVLIGMSKGTSLPDESTFAMNVIEKHYVTLKKDFMEFFPELIHETNKKLSL